jgi:histidinol-phosphate phosphatase family protein
MQAVFLDKDGTLIEDLPFNVDPDLIRLAPQAGAALRLLHEGGYALFVVSNQSGIARGLFSERAMILVQQRLRRLLRDEGVELDGFYYCPHHPQGQVARYAVQCACRKPMPGMLHEAARENGIALEQSWMIGDILHDIEAGSRAGCRTVLIDNGNETEWVAGEYRTPDIVAADLLAAAQAIRSAGAPRALRRPHSGGFPARQS